MEKVYFSYEAESKYWEDFCFHDPLFVLKRNNDSIVVKATNRWGVSKNLTLKNNEISSAPIELHVGCWITFTDGDKRTINANQHHTYEIRKLSKNDWELSDGSIVSSKNFGKYEFRPVNANSDYCFAKIVRYIGGDFSIKKWRYYNNDVEYYLEPESLKFNPWVAQSKLDNFFDDNAPVLRFYADGDNYVAHGNDAKIVTGILGDNKFPKKYIYIEIQKFKQYGYKIDVSNISNNGASDFKIGDWVKYRNSLTIMKIIEIKGSKAKLSYDRDDHWHDFKTLSKAEAPENKHEIGKKLYTVDGWQVKVLQFYYDPIHKEIRYIIGTIGDLEQKSNYSESALRWFKPEASFKVGEKIAFVDGTRKGKIIIYHIIGIKNDAYVCKMEDFSNTTLKPTLVDINFSTAFKLYVPFSQVPKIVKEHLTRLDKEIINTPNHEASKSREIRTRLYNNYCEKVIDLQLTELSFLN